MSNKIKNDWIELIEETETFKIIDVLCDKIENVIASNKEMELDIQAINELEIIYKKLSDHNKIN